MNPESWQEEATPIVRKFTPPSRDEVRLEAAEIGLSQHEAEKFYAYFESNGWKVGRNPMKKWTMALCSWRLRWLEWNGFVNVPKPKITLPSRPPAPLKGVEQSEETLKKYAAYLKTLRTHL